MLNSQLTGSNNIDNHRLTGHFTHYTGGHITEQFLYLFVMTTNKIFQNFPL